MQYLIVYLVVSQTVNGENVIFTTNKKLHYRFKAVEEKNTSNTMSIRIVSYARRDTKS